MALVARKSPTETWRDAVKRIAGEFGLEEETLAIYDDEVAAGTDQAHAAWNALHEWDCLDYEDPIVTDTLVSGE